MNGVEPELVITILIMSVFVLGGWAGYALRGAEVEKQQETIATLRRLLSGKSEAGRKALG